MCPLFVMKTYIGIDPGKTGGIAYINDNEVGIYKMPDTPTGLIDILEHIDYLGTCFAMVEKVHSTPQMGVKSAFTFGYGLGIIHTALSAAKIPYDEISPSKWQRKMQCLSKGDKNITKRRAQQLFPDIKVTHAIADALLIAEYCRRCCNERG